MIEKVQEEADWMDYIYAEALEVTLASQIVGKYLPSSIKSQVIRLYSSCLQIGTLVFGLRLVFLKLLGKWAKMGIDPFR